MHSLTCSSLPVFLFPSSLQPGEGLYHKLMQHKQSIYMQISLLTSEYVYHLKLAQNGGSLEILELIPKDRHSSKLRKTFWKYFTVPLLALFPPPQYNIILIISVRGKCLFLGEHSGAHFCYMNGEHSLWGKYPG